MFDILQYLADSIYCLLYIYIKIHNVMMYSWLFAILVAS